MAFFVRPPLQFVSGPHPRYALIWLHGLGADGHDFTDLVDSLAGITDQDLRFVFPHAPIQNVTLNGGAAMPAWFDLYGTRPEDPQDEVGIRQAACAVLELIRDQERQGVPGERIVLGGFSQGGAVALYTMLTAPVRLAATVGLSTYLPLAHRLGDGFPVNDQTPVFLGHGTQDPMIPYSAAVRTQAVLAQHRVPAKLHTYPMAHTVSAPELADLKDFLTAALGATGLGAAALNR